ncbi:Subunit of the glycosylphosphatidylinositol transamidase complex-like protein [Thecaphora frezii]
MTPARPMRLASHRLTVSRLVSCTLALFTAATSVIVSVSASQPLETFDEHLLLRPLPDGRLQTSFDFTLTSDSDSHHHFGLLPRPLLQVVQAYDVDEVHLSLNSGRWEYGKWGSPVRRVRAQDGQQSELPLDDGRTKRGQAWVHVGDDAVAPGAELWARLRIHPASDAGGNASFASPTAGDARAAMLPGPFAPEASISDRWSGLTSSLAGLFCTSLNTLDSRSTVMPSLALVPPNNRSRTLHAFLASESICTENLTPLLKLLPCKNHAGLASLLNPIALFSANFQGVAIHVRRRPPHTGGWEIKVAVQAVFSPAVTRDVSSRDWSLSSVLGRKLERSCPVATRSEVRVTTPDDQGFVSNYILDPLPPRPTRPMLPLASHPHSQHGQAIDESDWSARAEEIDAFAWSELSAEEQEAYEARLSESWRQWQDARGEYLFDTTSLADHNGSLDISMTWPSEQRYRYPHSIVPPDLEANRILSGSGLDSRLILTLRNHHASQTQRLVYLEAIPWFLTPLLHTLSARVEADPYDDATDPFVRFADEVETSPLESMHYQPSVPRRRPFTLELELAVPPRATVKVEMQVRKEFLRYAEHPPDAHRGFDLPPAVLLPVWSAAAAVVRDGWTKGARQAKIYTRPNLVELATPDFSFVYTNIIFTSTVIALFFGSTLNGMVRTFRDVVV